MARAESIRGLRVRGGSGGVVLGIILCGVAGGTLLGLGGCQKTALRPDDVRSPYDRYERSRSERAEPYVTDAFGRRTPNLRGRLLTEGE